MQVEEKKAGGTSTFKDEVHHNSKKVCKREFNESPERLIKK